MPIKNYVPEPTIFVLCRTFAILDLYFRCTAAILTTILLAVPSQNAFQVLGVVLIIFYSCNGWL